MALKNPGILIEKNREIQTGQGRRMKKTRKPELYFTGIQV
ncbi:hypothetical protein BSI_28610 [Bacillus inaquosorum KCTC 13429]|uniref:Uncharacterized protein n=1 Tax=Bacillus inaquosorum KCTC 13429 TaxID=1236548 RepID=A0A9W5LGT7_9BACI|nr:hypothetical protein BSI_28610 [Bacillus inaquosorum KCTC 13429]